MRRSETIKVTSEVRQGGYFWAENEVFDRHVSTHAKLVYLYLKRCADGDGTSWPSHATIGAAISASARQVQRALGELVEAGMLSLDSGREVGRPNYYAVLAVKPSRAVGSDRQSEGVGQAVLGGRTISPTGSDSQSDKGLPSEGRPNKEHPLGSSGLTPSTHTNGVVFRINEEITGALDRAPRLGAVSRLRNPVWWQAEVRANPGVDFAREVLKAEAWLTANSRRPKTDFPRFLHNWFVRAERDDE